MASSPVVSINAGKGAVSALASSVERWKLVAGTNPAIEVFDIMNADIGRLTNSQIDGVSLTIQNNDGGGGTWNKLSVLGFSPGPNENISRVTLADRRWTWPYAHVLKRLNARRNSGIRRRRSQRKGKDGNILFPIPGEIVSVIQFAKWSLFDEQGQEWTPEQAIMDVLTSPQALGILESDIVNDGFISAVFEQTRLDNVVIDDPGNIAVTKILKTIPGANLYIDPDGKVVLFSMVSGQEAAQSNALLPEIVSGGHVEFITNEQVRPAAIDIFFTMEVETRFDHIETQIAQTDTIAERQGKIIDERTMENVLPVPDAEIDLGRAETDAQGTWVEFNEYLNAAVIQTGLGLLKGLDVPAWHRAIQTGFIPEMDLWTALGLAGNADAAGDEVDWAARLAAWQLHYRRTYRLNSKWMDRVLTIRPWLLATIDQATGQRAPAMAYANYAVRNTLKAILTKVRNTRQVCYATNYDGFPSDPEDLGTGFPAPATLQIIDADQGILSVNYQLDPFNLNDIVFPSKIENNPCMPNKEANDPGKLTTFEQSNNGKRVKLSSDHRIAIVLTLVPASPNDKRQLYRIRITPAELLRGKAGRLTPAMQQSILNARGPVKEIRVGPGLLTALVAWPNDPNRNQDIERIFGVRDGEPNLDGLVVNDVDQAQIPDDQAASLKEFALSLAASVYAEDHDRLIGSQTGTLNHSIRPAGNLEEVAYEVAQNGVTTTSLAFPATLRPLDVEAFMNASTRGILFREVSRER